MNEEDVKNSLKWFTWPLIIIALIIGTVGYVTSGCGLSDSLYYSVCLFGLSFTDVKVNTYIEIARWLAPISVATTLFTEISPLFRWGCDRFAFWITGRCTVIFADSESGNALYLDMARKAMLCKSMEPFRWDKSIRRAVIMMNDDKKGLLVYQRLKTTALKAEIILCLNTMEPNLISSTGKTRIFNLNDLIAGAFWKNTLYLYDQFEKDTHRTINIVIMGYGSLGRRILYKGLLLNIFSPYQKIVYHVIDDGGSGRLLRNSIMESLMNDDEVYFYDNENDARDVMCNSDHLIIAKEMEPGSLQDILYSATNPEIYYPDSMELELHLLFGKSDKRQSKGAYECFSRLHGYGVAKRIITAQKIFNNKFNRYAALNNFWYLNLKHDGSSESEKLLWDEWEKTDGFTKGSNVNAVDYAETGKRLKQKGYEEEVLASMTHLHWCRYLLLNHWKYGETRDDDKLVHPCLKPYNELSETDKEKNRVIVRHWDDMKFD